MPRGPYWKQRSDRCGSVVTRDIPDWSVAAGNPCRVIRKITEEDRRKLFRNEEIDEEAWEDILSRIQDEK